MSIFFRFGPESPEVKQKRVEALKKAYAMKQEKLDKDPNSWWNRVKDMAFSEAKDLPEKDITRYVNMMNRIKYFQEELHIIRRDMDPRFQEHLDLNRLITDREREERTLIQARKTDELISPNELSPELNKKQPRNTKMENYNFEQFTEFTRLYERKMEEDRQKQYEAKRIFKYIKENPDQAISKSWKRRLLFGENSDPVNIEPFVDDSVDIKGFKPPATRRFRRQIIRTRTSRDITNFDCWRVTDRNMYLDEPHRTPVSKITVSPKQLIHVFGDPHWNVSPETTGVYLFEDNKLDLYVVAEPHSTTATRGPNKDQEYYDEQRKKFHKKRREQPLPNLEEFWYEDVPRVFFIHATPYAEFRKFKVWLRKTLEDNKDKPSFTERAAQKYGDMFCMFDEYDKDYNKYNERDVNKVGIFHYNWADFLDEKERKDLKNEIPELPKPAEFLPYDRARLCNFTREELEEMYSKERAKLEDTEL